MALVQPKKKKKPFGARKQSNKPKQKMKCSGIALEALMVYRKFALSLQFISYFVPKDSDALDMKRLLKYAVDQAANDFGVSLQDMRDNLPLLDDYTKTEKFITIPNNEIYRGDYLWETRS